MGIRRGEITTNIIKNGLVFNMDAANRASYIPDATTVFNTINLSESGSFVNDPTYISPPTSASCWDFDGADDLVSVSATTYAGVFSISFWINPEDFTLQFICGENGANQNYIWAQTATLLWFTAGGTATSFTESGGNDLVAGQWQNLIITRDGSNNVNVYKNGVSFGPTTTNAGTFTLDTIGKAGSSASWIYHGKISNVHIYNRALSPTEVLHNYNGLKGRFGL